MKTRLYETFTGEARWTSLASAARKELERHGLRHSPKGGVWKIPGVKRPLSTREAIQATIRLSAEQSGKAAVETRGRGVQAPNPSTD